MTTTPEDRQGAARARRAGAHPAGFAPYLRAGFAHDHVVAERRDVRCDSPTGRSGPVDLAARRASLTTPR